MKVEVRGNNLDRALKVFKRKLADDGFFRELQERMYYEKPSDKRKRVMRQAKARQRKADQERQARMNG